MKTLNDTVLAVVKAMSGGDANKTLGVREVCIAVEEAMGHEVRLADVHKALRELTNFMSADDPQSAGYRRQLPFAWVPFAGCAPRMWVYYRG